MRRAQKSHEAVKIEEAEGELTFWPTEAEEVGVLSGSEVDLNFRE